MKGNKMERGKKHQDQNRSESEIEGEKDTHLAQFEAVKTKAFKIIANKIFNLVSGSGSSTKSNQFVDVTRPTCPPNFGRIRPLLLCDILLTDKQTKKKTEVKTSSVHLWWRRGK